MNEAIWIRPSVRVGRIACRTRADSSASRPYSLSPDGGSRWRTSEKRRISMIPNQKLGNDTPNSATAEPSVSQTLPDLCGGFLGELAADQHGLGAPRSQAHEREQDDRDADEHEHGEADALEDVGPEPRLHDSTRAARGEAADEVIEERAVQDGHRQADDQARGH